MGISWKQFEGYLPMATRLSPINFTFWIDYFLFGMSLAAFEL